MPDPMPVIRVEDDPDHDDRVIVTDAGRNRANMTVRAFHATCRLAPGAQVRSERIIAW